MQNSTSPSKRRAEGEPKAGNSSYGLENVQLEISLRAGKRWRRRFENRAATIVIASLCVGLHSRQGSSCPAVFGQISSPTAARTGSPQAPKAKVVGVFIKLQAEFFKAPKQKRSVMRGSARICWMRFERQTVSRRLCGGAPGKSGCGSSRSDGGSADRRSSSRHYQIYLSKSLSISEATPEFLSDGKRRCVMKMFLRFTTSATSWASRRSVVNAELAGSIYEYSRRNIYMSEKCRLKMGFVHVSFGEPAFCSHSRRRADGAIRDHLVRVYSSAFARFAHAQGKCASVYLR